MSTHFCEKDDIVLGKDQVLQRLRDLNKNLLIVPGARTTALNWNKKHPDQVAMLREMLP